jgi:hypothetical protein
LGHDDVFWIKINLYKPDNQSANAERKRFPSPNPSVARIFAQGDGSRPERFDPDRP